MRDALLLELHEEAQDDFGTAIKKLRLVARRLVQSAIEGDTAAIKEINDRVDGKVPQQIQGDPDNPLVIATVTREIIHVDTTQRINPTIALSNARDPKAA
jgi:hypothetical protein